MHENTHENTHTTGARINNRHTHIHRGKKYVLDMKSAGEGEKSACARKKNRRVRERGRVCARVRRTEACVSAGEYVREEKECVSAGECARGRRTEECVSKEQEPRSEQARERTEKYAS
jgi:hypothetical protein